jgi:hypothetical protein
MGLKSTELRWSLVAVSALRTAKLTEIEININVVVGHTVRHKCDDILPMILLLPGI